MKCPKCQSENPEGAKFCNECGKKLYEAVETKKSPPVFEDEKSIRKSAVKACELMFFKLRLNQVKGL